MTKRLEAWIEETRLGSLKGASVEVPSAELLERLRELGYAEDPQRKPDENHDATDRDVERR